MSETSLAVQTSTTATGGYTEAFLDRIFPPPRTFGIRLWNGTTLPSPNDPPFTLVLTSPGSLRRMFRMPVELSMGEAYLRGDFEIEGDLSSAFELVPAARAAIRSPTDAVALALGWMRLPTGHPEPEGRLSTHAPARLRGKRGSRHRDRVAIQYHYDVGNDFYQLFLDRRMLYSCAYFPTGAEDLDTAQEAKLEHICRKLRLKRGERLLDIGCGWGGMLIYAARKYGVTGMGVTLSAAQLELARARVREAGLEGKIVLEQRDYRDLAGEPFDKIVSIGMFEHVGRIGLPDYFAQAYGLLRPGGLFLNHGIADRPKNAPTGVAGWTARHLDSLLVGNYTFRTRYIFPDGELVPVSEANLEAERAGFEVRDVENLREHYALTIRHWLRRLRERREEAIRIGGVGMYRLWELYLAGCIEHFDKAKISINQSLLARPGEGKVGLPWSRAELYRS
jgi:cyclopropane-fatty-acyl-phospholipid synthase